MMGEGGRQIVSVGPFGTNGDGAKLAEAWLSKHGFKPNQEQNPGYWVKRDVDSIVDNTGVVIFRPEFERLTAIVLNMDKEHVHDPDKVFFR
jgi:hypothetical protein